MFQVTIPCHELSRQVILAECGAEPVAIDKKLSVYGTLAGYAVGHVTLRNIEQFTSTITLLLPPDLAAHLEAHPFAAAERLYQVHKERLVWYVFAQIRAKGKGVARTAVADWLELYGIDEDQYSVDTAYKLFQRAGWEFDKKNRRFSRTLRTKSAAFLYGKRRRRARFYPPLPALPAITWTPTDQHAQLAASRFMAAYRERFRRAPVRLEKHAIIYAYYKVMKLSMRAVSERLNIPLMTISDAIRSLNLRASKNPTLRLLLDEMSALPQVIPTPALS